MEGVEIVIKPIHLERFIYAVVIIVLAVLLIVHWGGGKCDAEKEAKGTTVPGAGLNQTNQTNQTANTTQLTLCANGIKDQDETDIDCGGSKCNGCGENKLCNANTDCGTGFFCYQSIKCRKPSCTDGIKNQDETAVDCGGKCEGYWYDDKCNAAPKPTYSGKVDLSILSVAKSINAGSGSGYAKLDNVKFRVVNGKDKDVSLTAYVYARKESGTPYYESQMSGEEIPVATVDVPTLSLGENFTATANISKTLTQTEPTDAYKVVIQLRDTEDALVTETTWTNK
jgi:hypothetical protein